MKALNLLTLAAGIVLLAIAAGCGGRDGGTPGSETAQPPPSGESPVYEEITGRVSLELTAEQLSEALDIVANDARFQKLLNGLTYKVRVFGGWLQNGKLVGAGGLLELSEPVTLRGEWLSIKGDETGTKAIPYEEFAVPAVARNVDQLDVRVDLERGKLVSLMPHGPSVEFSLTGTPTPIR